MKFPRPIIPFQDVADAFWVMNHAPKSRAARDAVIVKEQLTVRFLPRWNGVSYRGPRLFCCEDEHFGQSQNLVPETAHVVQAKKPRSRTVREFDQQVRSAALHVNHFWKHPFSESQVIVDLAKTAGRHSVCGSLNGQMSHAATVSGPSLKCQIQISASGVTAGNSNSTQASVLFPSAVNHMLHGLKGCSDSPRYHSCPG